MINQSQGTLITWKELLNKGFEGERSSVSALGVMALSSKVLGSIITPKFPSEGALSILGALALP